MCVGRCSRLSSVHTVVVYQEAPFFFLPPSEPAPAQRSDRVSQRDVSATHWRRAAASSKDGPITYPGGGPEERAPRRQGRNCSCRVCDRLREKGPPRKELAALSVWEQLVSSLRSAFVRKAHPERQEELHEGSRRSAVKGTGCFVGLGTACVSLRSAP